MKRARLKTSGITIPSKNDVLFGRGQKIQNHPGNVNYRRIIESRRIHYVQAKKTYVKDQLARQVYSDVGGKMNPPGRFLKKERDGLYYIQDEQVTIVKIKQALRENAVETKDKIKIVGVTKKDDRYSPIFQHITAHGNDTSLKAKSIFTHFLPDELPSQKEIDNVNKKTSAAATATQDTVGETVKKRSQNVKLSNTVTPTEISQTERDLVDPDMEHVVKLLLIPSSDSEDSPNKRTKTIL